LLIVIFNITHLFEKPCSDWPAANVFAPQQSEISHPIDYWGWAKAASRWELCICV